MFLLSPPHRGRRRDLLQPGRHHHQHRDGGRGLVEGSVSRLRRPVPGRIRPADAVSERRASLFYHRVYRKHRRGFVASDQMISIVSVLMSLGGLWQ